MAEMGLNFIDLTLEPPAASPCQVDAPRIREALEVFTPDREYLRLSRDILRRLWDSTGG
jgi:hypothetical protein